MRRYLRFPLEFASTSAAVAIVSAFFVGDMIDAAGWDWRSWFTVDPRAEEQAIETSEIRNYVEFVSVSAGTYLIITGIEFDSSYQRRILKQWCYAERFGVVPGAAEPKVSLATKDTAGAVHPNLFTFENLRPVGLTEAEARAFLNDHCRFR
ncbi:hypothetical protein [Shinella sp.]|uniref:hypothetical protein n=1 Tax=Shinella sp. TaxID=1870904 RepID=UPI003F709507